MFILHTEIKITQKEIYTHILHTEIKITQRNYTHIIIHTIIIIVRFFVLLYNTTQGREVRLLLATSVAGGDVSVGGWVSMSSAPFFTFK